MKIKDILKWGIAIIISVVLVYILLAETDVNKIIETIRNVNLFYLGLFLLFYFLLMVLRSVRFRKVLGNKLSLNQLLPIVLFQNLLLNVIPFRIGELSYIYYVKKIGKQSYHKGISTLIITKVFDLAILITLFIIAVISLGKERLPEFANFIPFLIFFLVLMFSVLLLLIYPQKLLLSLATKLEKFILTKTNKFNFITGNLKKLIKAFEDFKSPSLLINTLILSILISVLGFSGFYFAIVSLGFYLPIAVLIIGSTFSVLANLLPVNGVAGLGIVEGIWALVLTLFGYSLEEAIVLGFSLHIIQLVAIIIM
ncbi:MAG: lysylphosphatidylglycerol synthase transmembrane domain-containing protein, partial [Nanoarchaeota archaeon]